MAGVVSKINNTSSCVPFCDFFVFNFEKETRNENLRYIKISKSALYSKLFKYTEIEKNISISDYDLIILRYVGADISLLKVLKNNPGKFVLEHHTKEIEELEKRDLPYIYKHGQILNEKLFLKMTSDYILGFTAVTKDILDYQIQRHLPKRPQNHLFPNGVNAECFLPRNTLTKESEINLVVIAGHFSNWHALDRLLLSLKEYPGPSNITLEIVGDATEHIKLINGFNSKFVSLNYHGKLKPEAMNSILSNASIAIDSLGLHRIGFVDSSTLKSRDYLLRCVPMMKSCPDMSLTDVDDYIFYAEHNDNLIDFVKVTNWYENLNNIDLKDRYESLIHERLSWPVIFSGLSERFL